MNLQKKYLKYKKKYLDTKLILKAGSNSTIDFASTIEFGNLHIVINQVNKPAGVAILPDGRIVVAGSEINRIQIFNQDGTYYSQFGSSGYENGQLISPSGVAILPNRTIVVVDTGNNRIQLFNKDGKYLSNFGSEGNSDGQMDFPFGVAILPDGKIVVADTGNHRIQIFNKDGTYSSQFGSKGSGDGQMSSPQGIAILEEKIVVVDTENNRIQIFDKDGKYLLKFGSRGNGNGQMNNPHGVAILPDGKIVVADSYNHRIQIFNKDGTYSSQFGSRYSSNNKVYFPHAVAILLDGRIAVTDSRNNSIQIFHQMDMWEPHGVSIIPGEDIVVADTNNHRIQIFNKDGKFLSHFGSNGSGNGQMNFPFGVAILPDGKIVVADTGNHRIQIFNKDGTYSSQFGSNGSGDGQMNKPAGIAILDEKIVVTDSENHRVQIFNKDGTYSSQFGSGGSDNGQMNFPTGIAILDGKILVVDSENHRIQIFDKDGKYLSQFGSKFSYEAFKSNGILYYPYGISILSDGKIVVTDTGNDRIQIFNKDGTYFSQFSSAGSANGQMKRPTGLVILPDGKIVVADTLNNRVQIFNENIIKETILQNPFGLRSPDLDKDITQNFYINYITIGKKKYYQSIYDILKYNIKNFTIKLNIKFYNITQNMTDEGIDANGLTKESFNIFIDQILGLNKILKKEYNIPPTITNFEKYKIQLDTEYNLLKNDKIKFTNYRRTAIDILTNDYYIDLNNITDSDIKEEIINIQLEEKFTEKRALLSIDSVNNIFDVFDNVSNDTYINLSQMIATFIYNNCVISVLPNPYLLWTFYDINNLENFKKLSLDDMLSIGLNANLINDEFPYACINQEKFINNGACNLVEDANTNYISINYCDVDEITKNCKVLENGKIKLSDENISNMKNFLINDMTSKFINRQKLMMSIRQSFEFQKFKSDSFDLLIDKICGRQSLKLVDFIPSIKFSNEFSQDAKNATIEVIKEHSKNSKLKKDINIYLEALLFYITGSKRISSKIIQTGIYFMFRNNVNNSSPPINAHTCFNQFDIRSDILEDVVIKFNQSKIKESELYKWLDIKILTNVEAQSFSNK
jgi:hypothetical protein